MYTHLKERAYYEKHYDDQTIAICRRNEQVLLDSFLLAVDKTLPELAENPTVEGRDPIEELARVHHTHHFFYTNYEAGLRWEKRDKTIADWMAEDEAKDLQIESSRLTSEPVCQHCGKTGLRITSKELMHRGDDWDEPEEVLIMLSCTHCSKASAYWEDGTSWESPKTYCPKCKAIMTRTSSRKGKVITTTYICPACDHSYKDTMDLRVKPKPKEKPDPNYEKDKARFCFNEEQGKEFLKQKQDVADMGRIVEGWREKKENKAIYDAVAAVPKVNIAQLTEMLKPSIEKAGYTEFSLDKPEIGRDVVIGFNCLDSKSDRADYDSRATLKKVVTKALADTNWRLMSDGISYRLGYLNGRIRAYEYEDDLKKLVMQEQKLKSKSKTE